MQRDMSEQRYGQPPYADDKYDDIADIEKVISLPDEAIHRNIDKIVLAASANSAGGAVRTAIVGPPCISGAGRGPVNTRSIQYVGSPLLVFFFFSATACRVVCLCIMRKFSPAMIPDRGHY